MIPQPKLNLSGERFAVWYRLTGSAAEAQAKAADICLEQTVEFPDSLVPDGSIREEILGRIEAFEPDGTDCFQVKISYAVETAGPEPTQLLNVIFGNISIKPGIRVERLELTPRILALFPGPRFGRAGLRDRLGVAHRPLLCTALKPMGLSSRDLGTLAYQFALGGIDIIKDDHGLADQPFAPFRERVQYCAAAVAQANLETGGHSIYMPNLTARAEQMKEKAYFAKQAGAGGFLVSPGLTGLDTLCSLAGDDQLSLPLFSHPAFQGSYVISPANGISHAVLFGQLARLAGADATIFPNYGGRFSFSRAECRSIVAATGDNPGDVKPIFPAPGGGMTLEKIADMREIYGREVVFLIGGGLHSQGPDLVANCRHFLSVISDQ